MLTAADNAALTQVGPGTPLGKFFRRYWIPAAKSEEIREPGGARCVRSRCSHGLTDCRGQTPREFLQLKQADVEPYDRKTPGGD